MPWLAQSHFVVPFLPTKRQAFEYMTRRNFSSVTALPAAVVGSVVMWGLAGRLRARQGVANGGERTALCGALDEFVDAIAAAGGGRFHGGAAPDLADLAVFGSLRAVQGLDTERDVMTGSRIGPWLTAMHAELSARAPGGSALECRVGEAARWGVYSPTPTPSQAQSQSRPLA